MESVSQLVTHTVLLEDGVAAGERLSVSLLPESTSVGDGTASYDTSGPLRQVCWRAPTPQGTGGGFLLPLLVLAGDRYAGLLASLAVRHLQALEEGDTSSPIVQPAELAAGLEGIPDGQDAEPIGVSPSLRRSSREGPQAASAPVSAGLLLWMESEAEEDDA